MKNVAYFLVIAFACGIWAGSATKAPAAESASIAGTWQIESQGQNGTMTQTLTLQQDGNSLKGTLSGRRGDSPVEGSINGNEVHFTVKRQGRDGGTMVIEYTATVDGNSMKGKVHSERFGDRDFKAKRSQ